jgi:FkbM family methyltransferase
MVEHAMKQQIHSRVRLARTRATKLGRLAQHPGYWRSARQGVVASVEHHAVPFSDDIRTVFDVGASRGQFALFAVERFPKAQVTCFEPLPESRAALASVLDGRVEVRPVAVGAAPGTAELQVSAQDDSSSLLPIGSRQIAEFPGTARASTLEVPVVALEAEIGPATPGPRLLKIDVQGLELEVLKGAGRALDLIDEAFIECSFVELYEGQALADEVVAFLLDRGLRLAGIYGISYSADGSAVQADFLFRRHAGADR